MKKLILIGRSGVGKTTLTQALRGEKTHYHKTQYINYDDFLIDTPGEYAENVELSSALCLYSYEADVVALLIPADAQYTPFPPNITCMVNREVIGVVTKIDEADPQRATEWLKLSGCEIVFHVDSKTGKGVNQILEHLKNNTKQEK